MSYKHGPRKREGHGRRAAAGTGCVQANNPDCRRATSGVFTGRLARFGCQKEGTHTMNTTPAYTANNPGYRATRKALPLVIAVLCGLIWASNPVALAKPPSSKMKPTRRAGADKGPEAVKPEGPAPIIKAVDPVKDFGTTWVGPTLKHTFTIKNEGDAPLEISKVRPACGCTVAGAYPKTIEPGQTGKFPFSVNSNKLRGKYAKSITISSNDPVTPALKLKIRGECKRYVEVLPTNANFGKVTTNEPQERVLTITNNTDQPLQIKMTKTEDKVFKFDLVEKKAGQNYELHIKMEPPYIPGAPRGVTTLVTNIEKQKDIRINASARIPERLEVTPSVISMSPERYKDRGYSRPIRFTNYGSTPVNLLGVTSDDPQSIQVAFKERTAGRAYTINVDMPAGYSPPGTGRTITLKTDDPKKPIITVPVKIRQARTAKKPPQKRPAEELVGKPAPNFSATTTLGASLSSRDLQGKVTVLDFFAVNCGYCGKQIPRLEQVRKTYADKGVRFVTVSQTMRKKFTDAEVKAKINDLGFQGELVIDHDNTLGPKFKSTSFPTMVVIGKTGKIEAVNVGNVGDLEDRMKGQLNALLAGKPVPQIAKKTPPKSDKPDKPRKRPAEELVGKPAPKYELVTTTGKKLSNDTLAGKVTVLDFFAVNCGYCGKQIPRVEEIRKTYASKGVEFVVVSQTMRKKFTDDEVKAKINDLGFKGDLAIDSDNKVGPLFKAQGFPTMVIVGKTGKIEAVNIGNVGDLETRMKTQLDAMLVGKPVPQVAKKQPPKSDKPDKPRKRPAEELVGNPAPKFELTRTDGKKVSNETVAGKVTVLDFFSVNCGFCGKQIPRVEEIRKTYASKGVEFVAVSQTMRKPFTDDEVKAKINDLGFKGGLAIDSDNKVGPLFKARGFPTMVIIGKTGKIEAVNIGNMGDLETRMKTQLDAMLVGKPVPQVAKKQRPKSDKPDKPRKRPAEELVGKPAPKFELTRTDGKKVSNETVAGKVTVLDFFSVNCGFCGKQIPRVEEIRKTYASKGVEFVAVSQTMRKPFTDDEVKAKINDLGFKGGLAIDSDNKVGPLFKARGFPTMVIVGKTGKVEAVNIGNMGDLETRMKTQLDAMLAGKPVPQIAKKTPPTPDPAAKRRKRPAEEMVGQAMPKFELTMSDGKKVASESLAGTVTVLDFFSTRCGHCMKQIPRVEEIRKAYAAKGVRFVAVGQSKGGDEAAIKEKADSLGFKGELAIDTGKTVSSLFKVGGVPSMAIIGKTGKIEAVTVGNVGNLEERMKGQLNAMLTGKPVPQFADKTPPQAPKQTANVYGKPAPKFEAKTTDGKTISNETLANTVTVLDFFATNCGYCKKQLPRVEEVRKNYEAKGVRFIAVSQTMRKKSTDDEIKAKIDEFGFKGELVMDGENKIGRMFGVRGFPTMVVLGKTGKVEAINVGNIGDLETKIPGQLDALLAGKPIPEKYVGKPRSRSSKRPAEQMAGKPAPAFGAIKTQAGKDVSNADFGAHPATVLNFVAANCGYCKRQVPKVESIREEYEKKGVRFVNVVMTMRKEVTTEEAVKVFKDAGSNLELAHDAKNTIGGKFKATSFPTMMVVDRQGKVAHVNIGAKPDIDTMLKGQLDKLIAGGSAPKIKVKKVE